MKIFWRIITSFLKKTWLLLNFFRNLIINFLFISLIFTCIIYWININHNTKRKYSTHSALLMNINGTIVDRPVNNIQINAISKKLFSTTSSYIQENFLLDIVDMIRKAKYDRNITGIVLDLKNFTGSDQPSMQYIGKALSEFRDSGKPVIALGNNYSQGQYYLASFANKIWLSPYGKVGLQGFAAYNLYYKSFLDKLKVTTHVFRIGTYKSAVEPFIRNNMSSIARNMDNYWINKLWHYYLLTIANNRHINTLQVFPGVKEILNGLRKTGGNTAQYALDNKLVDALNSNAEIEVALSELFGWNEKSRNYCSISMYDYISSGVKIPKIGDTIAVIFVNGAIINGKERLEGNIGSDTITTQIRLARLDPKVKAIILRINSPGGSVTASESIREELVAARIAGKPIVVSMGGMAASGGYWISTPANYIIADRSTLTGSIGIFGIINTIENSLDYLGIHADGVTTSSLADIGLIKKLPLEVSQLIQLDIENNYKNFINIVSQSRKKTQKQIDKIAQGHIWIGSDAKNNGLVDSLGDFDDAVLKAVELAKLKKWHLDYYQNKQNIFDIIIDYMTSLAQILLLNLTNAFSPILTIILQSIKTEYNKLLLFNDPQNCYALCLICTNLC